MLLFQLKFVFLACSKGVKNKRKGKEKEKEEVKSLALW